MLSPQDTDNAEIRDAKKRNPKKKTSFECEPRTQCGKDKEAMCVKPNSTSPFLCLCIHNLKPPVEGKCALNIVTGTGTPSTLTVIIPRGQNHTQHQTASSTSFTESPPTRPSIQSSNNNLVVVASVVGLLISIAGLFIFWKICHGGMFGRRKADKKKALIPLTKTVLLEERYTTNPQYTSAGGPADTALPTVPIIHRSVITDLQEVGEGFFGQVYKGQLHVIIDGDEKVETVAVKMLKPSTNLEAEEDFMREVEIMSSFRHDNILSLTGFCPRDNVNGPWMVFEYMPFGDLATVLRNSNHQFWLSVPGLPRLSSESLLTISLQIAEGMEYLARQRFVHRDLACRNCLVGSGLVVKIADFGMSRDVYTCDYYKIGGVRMLPVRWMAPESIVFGKFTLESDIWSYGVVLWEIFSYGRQPYFGHTNEEALKYILDKQLLEVPEWCPVEVKEIMFNCWKTDPKERITFSEICNRFVQMSENNSQQLAMPLPRPPEMPVTINYPAFVEEDEEDDFDYDDKVDDDKAGFFDEDKLEDPFYEEDEKLMEDSYDDDKSADDVFEKESTELLDEEGYLQPYPSNKPPHPEYFQPLA